MSKHSSAMQSPSQRPPQAADVKLCQYLLLKELPEATLSYILAFLHGFNLAGRPAITCKTFAAACQSKALCQHAFSRDLEKEQDQGLPAQPGRQSRHSAKQVAPPLCLEALCRVSNNTGDSQSHALLQLRAIAKALCHKSFGDIGYLAAIEGRPALLQWVIGKCDLDHLAGDPSAAMVAATSNHPRTTALAARACDLDRHHGRFGTALHQAAYIGAAAAVAELVLAGASVKSRNLAYGQTPLHVACSRNHVESVRILLEAGSDALLQDQYGLTAEGIAATMQSNDVLRVLECH